MFRNKQELDNHVHDVLSKVKGERERAMRCFNFSKQYAAIREFGAAKRYMEKYLTTNPSNAADALKLIGDFLVETEELDRALEFYKSSYKHRKSREALTRICDLLERGCGTTEDKINGNQKWFELLKSIDTSTSIASPNQFSVRQDSSPSNNSNINRSASGTGPPKTGFSNHRLLFSNSSINTPTRSVTQVVDDVESHHEFGLASKITVSPDRSETQIRNLERRFDDVLGKILGSVQRIENDMKDLRGKVDTISAMKEESPEKTSNNTKTADNLSKSNEKIDANQNAGNENSFVPNPLQQVPQYFDYPPNPGFGFGFPFAPSPFHNPYFNANPMLAALYGNPLFGNPLAGAGMPRNGVPQPATVPLSETSLLAGLLSQNQFMPPTSLSSLPIDTLYPQIPLQAPIVANSNLTDKLWQQPQQVPSADSLGLGQSLFSNPNSSSITSIVNPVTSKIGAESNSNITVNQPAVSTTPTKIETPETKIPATATTPVGKKEAPKGKTLFPENVVVSNTEKVPTVASSSYSNILSVTIPPEHRNVGLGNNNSAVNNAHNFQIAAPTFKPLEPNFDKKSEETVNPFSNIALKASSAISFGDLANNGVATGFGDGKSFFEGGAKMVFANVVASQSAAGDAVVRHDKIDRVDGDEGADDFIPTAEFQPVIPLPPLVEVKKGNENENVLFEHRAKIYRFVTDLKEWKERGVGNIMILQDKDNDRKIRVVMWRERVYKLACNHRITKDLVVENHQGSPKVLKWTALDFADGDSEGKMEIFTCRFGNEDKCAEFKLTMERMIAFLATKGDASPHPEKTSVVEQPKPEQKSLSELFKKSAGSWDCGTCYVNNPEKEAKCVSCGTANAAKPFHFQAPSLTTTNSGNDSNSQQLENGPFSNIALKASSAISFGDLANNCVATGFGAGFGDGKSFFEGGAKLVFGNIVASQSAAGDAVVRHDRVDGEEVADDFVPTAEFQPVIPLPPLVEVKKGNENENVLFEHRAKIYRFVTDLKEWKERGVGNIMILQDKDNDRKIRVVMWRERVYKLACNHRIHKDLVIESHQGRRKVLKWTALDFADPDSEGKMEIFTCRFGNEEKCAEFKLTMERMIAFLATKGDSSPYPEKTSPVEQPKPEQKSLSELFKKAAGSWDCGTCYVNNPEKEAKCVSCGTAKPFRFQAPSLITTNSGNETNSPQKEGGPCPGCRGCDPDSFDFSALDRRVLPACPKETIRKIDSSAGNQLEKINAPKCTPVTESQLYELLTPDTSPKKVTESASSTIVPPQFKFGFSGINNSSNDNTVISPPKFNFQFNPDNSASNAVIKPAQFKFGFTDLSNNPPSSEPFKFQLGKLDSIPSSTTVEQTPSISINPDIFVPSVVSQNLNQQISSTSMPQFGVYGHEEDNDNDDDDDEDDDENDEEDSMFDSEAQLFISESLDSNAEFDDLGDGLIRIIYDGEQFCSRLYFLKDEECLIDHIIAAETTLEPLGNLTFQWSGVSITEETAVKIKMRVKLPDQQAYDAFSCTMAESTDFAVKAHVTECCLLGDDEGSGDDS